MTNEIKPLVPLSTDTERLKELAKELLDETPLSAPRRNQNAQSLDGYIYVPSADVYLAKKKDLLGLSWNDAQTELSKKKYKDQGVRMPTIYEGTEFIKHLLANPQGTNDAPSSEVKSILEELLKKEGSWRGEWLDAYFEQRQDGLYILTENKTKSEKLNASIMEDCYVDLSFNSQGMPTQKSSNQNYVQGQNIYHWYPRDKCVARFDANADWVNLDCIRDPAGSDPSLGVRFVREAHAKK